MIRLLDAATVMAALGTGAMGGVFFAFSTFVMRGLNLLPPGQAVAAMQQVNITAINRWFMAGLFGTALLCIVIGGSALLNWAQPGAPVRFVGCLVYLLGTIVVTIVCNVPRNDALAALSPDPLDVASQWAQYYREWTNWNHVRAISSLVAAAVLTLTLIGCSNPT